MEKYVLKSGVEVSVFCSVKQEIAIGDKHMLLLMTQGSDTPDNNVICFSSSGVKQWTVEAHVPVPGDQNPYMNMKESVDSDLLCRTWNGLDVVIDCNTGKIKNVVNSRPW